MYHKRRQLQFDQSEHVIRMTGLIKHPHIYFGVQFICPHNNFPPQ